MCIVNVKYWSTSASMLWRRVFMTISSFFASHDCSRLTITIVGWKSRNIRLSMAPTMRQLFAVNSNAIFVQHVFVLFQTWVKEIEDVRSFKSQNSIIILLMVDRRWKETLWKQSVLRIGAVLPFAIWWVWIFVLQESITYLLVKCLVVEVLLYLFGKNVAFCFPRSTTVTACHHLFRTLTRSHMWVSS